MFLFLIIAFTRVVFIESSKFELFMYANPILILWRISAFSLNFPNKSLSSKAFEAHLAYKFSSVPYAQLPMYHSFLTPFVTLTCDSLPPFSYQRQFFTILVPASLRLLSSHFRVIFPSPRSASMSTVPT